MCSWFEDGELVNDGSLRIAGLRSFRIWHFYLILQISGGVLWQIER
jgi:hypothetical protein